MPDQRTDDTELMRYLDGELAPREAREVERALASDPEGQKRLEALRQLGDVTRARIDLALAEAAPALDAMWAKLERQLEPAPRRAAVAEPEREPRGFMASLREWFSGFGGYALTGGLSAAAAAALVLATRSERVVEKPVVQYVEVPAPAKPEGPRVIQAAEVERLEVRAGEGTIFQVPSDADDEPATTVIWISRDDQRGPEGPI